MEISKKHWNNYGSPYSTNVPHEISYIEYLLQDCKIKIFQNQLSKDGF